MDAARTPFFSIIIPTYNYAQYLPRALNSVSAQTGGNYEIVVVDDGSTDETVQVVTDWISRNNKQVIYLTQPNRGVAAARNQGIDHSTGEFLLFLDADDALLPGALERFQSAVVHQDWLDFVYGGRMLVWVSGKVKHYPPRQHLPSNEQNFFRYTHDGFIDIGPGSAVIRRRVFNRVRFPEGTRVWEDIVFHAQLFALFSGASIPDSVIAIYRHPDSLSHKYDLSVPSGTVDMLFDPSVLPEQFFRFRSLFICRTRLTLFEAFYRHGAYNEAAKLFRDIVRICPGSLLSWRLVRRYLTVVVKKHIPF